MSLYTKKHNKMQRHMKPDKLFRLLFAGLFSSLCNREKRYTTGESGKPYSMLSFCEVVIDKYSNI